MRAVFKIFHFTFSFVNSSWLFTNRRPSLVNFVFVMLTKSIFPQLLMRAHCSIWVRNSVTDYPFVCPLHFFMVDANDRSLVLTPMVNPFNICSNWANLSSILSSCSPNSLVCYLRSFPTYQPLLVLTAANRLLALVLLSTARHHLLCRSGFDPRVESAGIRLLVRGWGRNSRVVLLPPPVKREILMVLRGARTITAHSLG
jgi:hypothetical protein